MNDNFSDKKRILHLSHTDIRSDSRILKELAALSENERYIVSAIGVDSGEDSRGYKSLNNVFIESVPLFFSKYKWRPSILRHILVLIEFFIKVLIRAGKHRPDVIHCHDTLALFFGGVLSLFLRVKIVYDAHELESLKSGQSKLGSMVVLFIEKILWTRVSLLISVSPSILTWYEENLGPKQSSLILNTPVIDESIKGELTKSAVPGTSTPKYFHNYFQIPDESKVFIYLGLLVPGRGVELLLESFSTVGDKAHVVFMGNGELNKLILKSSETHTNIHYHPAVSHYEVVNLTKDADIGLCFIENISLSYYYCLPNKLFEYAFSRIPVLASGFPDLKEYINKYQLGYCSDNTVESIQEQVNKIVQSPLEYSPCDIDDLSWQVQAKKLMNEYETLLFVN